MPRAGSTSVFYAHSPQGRESEEVLDGTKRRSLTACLLFGSKGQNPEGFLILLYGVAHVGPGNRRVQKDSSST
jgi:hypothetical protein